MSLKQTKDTIDGLMAIGALKFVLVFWVIATLICFLISPIICIPVVIGLVGYIVFYRFMMKKLLK